jgi:hypothetical protein
MIVLIFSLPGLRHANGLLCMGVALGGFVAAWIEGKAQGNRLDTVRGLVLGARVGVTAAVIALAVSFIASQFDLRSVLDPLPQYLYAAIYGIYDGLIDEIIRSEADGLEMPGMAAHIFILLMSTFLFGGFGGGVAASTFVREPAIDEARERSAADARIQAYNVSAGRTQWTPLHQIDTQSAPASASLRRPRAPISVAPPEPADRVIRPVRPQSAA